MIWRRSVEGDDGSGKGRPTVEVHLHRLLEAHGLTAFDRQQALAGLVGELDWELDQDLGLLRFGTDVSLRAQIIGTTSSASHTWRWAWANPTVAEPLTERAREARRIGLERGIGILTEPDVDLARIGSGHLLALATAGLLDADAYYRCPHEGGEVFVIVEEPTVRTPPDEPVAHALETISRALIELPVGLTRDGIRAYLQRSGVPTSESGAEMRIGDGDEGGLRFDADGRLVEASHTRSGRVSQSVDERRGRHPIGRGTPLREWQDPALEELATWRDERGRSPIDVLLRYQTERHDWEHQAGRADAARRTELSERLAALYEEVATPRPMAERDTTFQTPPTRDPDRTRVVAVTDVSDAAATIRLEEDNAFGSVDHIEVRVVRLAGEWRLQDRVAVYEDERISGLL